MKELLLPTQRQFKLATELYRKGLFGIHEDPADYVPLKSGRLSPHYLNARLGLSIVSMRDVIVDSMVGLSVRTASEDRGSDVHTAYTHVVGTPEAMTSYAGIIADRMRMSLLQPRVDMSKTTGNKAPILGVYDQGDTVAAYDDVITDGDSKKDMIDNLTAQGLEVVDYFVLLDREEGGARQLEEVTGMSVTPAIGVTGLVATLRSEDLITDRQFANVREYLGLYGDPGSVDSLDQQLY